MTIKARLYVSAVTAVGSPTYREVTGVKSAERVELQAIYSDDKNSPNYSYSQATPQAKIELLITNPDAWDAFLPGHSYDVTFEATKPAAAAGDGVTGDA